MIRFSLLTIAVLVYSHIAKAQLLAEMVGPQNVCPGQRATYEHGSQTCQARWAVTGGRKVSENGFSVTVDWGTGTRGSVQATFLRCSDYSSQSMDVRIITPPRADFTYPQYGYCTGCKLPRK